GGNAGSLAINDVDELTLQGRSSTTVSSTEQGRAGGLAINAQTVSLNDGSAITGTTEAGRGNNIDLSIAESLRLNNNSQISASTQSGQGGNITIDGLDFLQVLSSLISAESTTGQAGQLSVNASNSVLLYGTGDQNRGGLSVQSRGGSAGDLNITTSELNIRNGASIAVSNSGQGNAGRLTVTARDVSLNQGSITGRTEAGEGGSIILRIADSLQLRNNSQISASTRDGQGGDITLRGLDSLQVFNSLILAESRSGRAGELNVNASDFVLLDGRGDGNRGGLSVRSRGGRAGDLSVTTNELDIRDGASIAVSNTGQEDAGALTITARDVSLNRGRITGTTVAGVGGNIQLDELNSLLLNDGSEISASTETGQGGNLRINTREGGDIVLDESRLAAEATSGGRAGNLVIRNADYLTVEEGSSITVSSAEGAAGNLRIVAGSVSLDNGTLEAVAGAGNDANITLNVSGTLFQLSNGSRVSAQALNDASGGNVELNVSNGFVVANPLGDNDIVANASQGNGGRVNIDALQIFGLEERTEDTPLSDINVSSTFGSSGTTEINTLNVNPAQGVVALPENVAPPTQVDQRCATGSGGTAGDRGAFVVSGRGGLPPNADEALGSDAVQVNLVTAEAADSAFTPTVSLPETDVGDGAIVEAQGWVVDANGNVVLTAAASTVTPNQSQYGTIECPIQ
ncbi:MAG TPA: S-layer family protein, partial [Allocoleopsis sp.]